MKYIIALVLTLAYHLLFSQSYAGVTGVKDTSYTTVIAYEKHVVKYPFIEIVEEFNYKNIRETRGIAYCDQYGRELVLDIFEPKEPNHIAILIIHGGGWRSGDRSQHYPLAQSLAHQGYTCITPEYRLSTEALFPAAVYDIKAAIRWARTHASLLRIHPEQIVVCGYSAGGELAAFMGTTGNMPIYEGTQCHTKATSHANAVIDIDGTLSFVHPESGEGDDSKRTSAATHWLGYSKHDMPQLWYSASPLTHANQQTPPTLFLNSSKATMHAGRSDYIKILDQYNIYSQVYNFENAPHGFCLFHPWYDTVVEQIDHFLGVVFSTN